MGGQLEGRIQRLLAPRATTGGDAFCRKTQATCLSRCDPAFGYKQCQNECAMDIAVYCPGA